MPGYWKLNSFAGYTKQHPDTFPDPGQPALAYEIGYLLGIPIDYYASINICGFPQLIDEVGGVDVCNSKTIDDPGYPLDDGTCGFHLDPGMYHMDGATALAYARSRHGSSDFARAKRQQQLLGAIRQAILAPDNLARLPDIVTTVGAPRAHGLPAGQHRPAARAGQPGPGRPHWAVRVPASDVGAAPAAQPDQRALGSVPASLDKIAALSSQVFGSKSLYSSPAARYLRRAGRPARRPSLSRPADDANRLLSTDAIYEGAPRQNYEEVLRSIGAIA